MNPPLSARLARPSRHQAALLTAALFWGSSATFTKSALDALPPLTLLVVQLASATAVLWAALLVRGGGRPPGRRWLARLGLLGLLEPALAYAFFTFGLTRTTASNASLLSGLESFFAIGMACLFLRERLTGRACAALVLALAGVATLEGLGSGFAPHAGDGLVLVGVLCAAAYVMLAARTAEHVDALTMTAYQFTFGLLFTLPFAAARWADGSESLPAHVTAGAWTEAGLSGVVGYAGSFLLYNYAIKAVRATTAAMVLNLIPVFGIACAGVVLGERLTGVQVAGAALIVGAVVVFSTTEAGDAAEAGDTGKAGDAGDGGDAGGLPAGASARQQ
ncbi:DMT family transporter [Streptomyces sp. ISL-11]|uniref:DMT family transporter n=1 Tax=Streptomyces sp. ISL-11 TaxID=2819174 RepID=UPI001BEB3050|nr:DMT family transporter [Streptomyces sp. ISL-11]MBT2383461.1 DMT family transporter [Streptomyces sp. ISL-11]